MLLGGDRLTDQYLIGTDTLGPGILGENSLISTVSANEIIFQGKYPMQRSTSPQVYLRCDLPNDNIESASLNRIVPSGADFSGDSSLSSNILGVFQKDFEFSHYDLLGDEFFINLRSKSLSHICARSDILIQICVCRAHRPGSDCLRERFFFIAKWSWHSIYDKVHIFFTSAEGSL